MSVDAHAVALAWLNTLQSALASGSASDTAACIHPKGYLRDFQVFSWNNRCLHGHPKTAAFLSESATALDSLRKFELEQRPGLMAEYGRMSDKVPISAVSAAFTFKCGGLGPGRGQCSLVLNELGQWKALVLMLALTELAGHEEDAAIHPEWRQTSETNPDVLIIGAGQNGLNVAARFRRMKIPTLLIETNARVGDNWRKRYPTLALHTPNKGNSMLYQDYPSDWPDFIPRDRLADWLEQYSQTQELAIWTSSRVLPRPTYDLDAKRWNVLVDRNGQTVQLAPAHIIVAAGALGAPRMPSVPGRFSGTVIHSSQYQGGAEYAGKRVLVVGAGNTAADVCYDLVQHGSQSVTMLQRSGSWVVSRDTVCRLLKQIYPPNLDLAVSDFLAMGRPNRLTRKFEMCAEKQTLKDEEETHRGLKEAGFNLCKGNKGFLILWYEAYGGYWVDIGCADLIKKERVKVKQGVQISRFRRDSVVFTDGTSLEADTVVFATSHESITRTLRPLFGETIMDKVGPVWGLDEEGEVRGCYRPLSQPGLWFACGEFAMSRTLSKPLALMIKAMELGLMKDTCK